MSSMVPRIGDVIADKYRIERRLGGGGMGTVFAASHLMTGRRFAIKWMNTRSGHDTGARERFIREFQAAGSIDHPNVVAVLDVGSHDGTLYIVMEYLEGESLGKKISRGPMAPSECVPIVVEAMRGVAAAHRLDIVHRDLKPDNIFVCAHDRAGLTVKVLDFGVSKPVNERAQSLPTITARGIAVGTPPYMAPEQVLALPSLDHRVDIYSFGVILYEALSGRLPYADVTGLLLLERIVRGGPPSLSQFASGVPIGLEATVMRALSRDPRRRFQQLADFAACLQPWAAGAGAFGTVAPAARRLVSGPELEAAMPAFTAGLYEAAPAVEARALPSETRTSTPDALAALAKGRESYPRRDPLEEGTRARTSTPAPASDAHADRTSDSQPEPAQVVQQPAETDASAAPPEVVDVAPLAAVPAVEVVSHAKPTEEKSSRRGRKRKKRRKREREREAKAAAAPAAQRQAASAAKPESEQTPAGAASATQSEPAQPAADATAATPTAAGAGSPKTIAPEPRAELPIEVALRRALAREGRLPLRHAWNAADVDASATPANDAGTDNAFAELNRESAVAAPLAAVPAAHNDQLGAQSDPSAEDDGDPRRSRVPTLPLKLQDIEALRAAFQFRRDDSATSPETAITREMVAPRSTRVSMHELSPWPAEEPQNSWSAPTEMAIPAPRIPAMRNRGGWGLVSIAVIVVCGIAWTQWDPEETFVETEESVSAASDVFASNPDDPFAELAPSLADPPPGDLAGARDSDDPAESYELGRSRAASNYEYPSSIDLPDAPPAAASSLTDIATSKAAAEDSLPAPSPAPLGFGSEERVEPAPAADALARGALEPSTAADDARASLETGGQARANANAPFSASSEAAGNSAPRVAQLEHDVASASAPTSLVRAANSAGPESEAAAAMPLPAPGKVVVVPAFDSMGPSDPAAQAAMNGARGTSAASTPAVAGTPTPPTSASAAPAPPAGDARAAAPAASAAAPAPPAQPIDGHAAIAQREAVLLAPARAPEGRPEPAARPQPSAAVKPIAPTKAGAAALIKPNAHAAPNKLAARKPPAQTPPTARTSAAAAAQAKPYAQPRPPTRTKSSAKVTVTKLELAPPQAAQPRARPKGATVDVPSSAARSGNGKSPPPRKTSGVSVADF